MKSRNEFENKILTDVAQKGFSYFETESIVAEYTDALEIIDELNRGVYKATQIDYKVRQECLSENSARCLFGYSASYFIYDEKCEPVRIRNIVSFLSIVFSNTYGDFNRYFRGQKAHYDLVPSLFRNSQNILNEMEINSRIYNDRLEDFLTCRSTFDKLVKLKHFDAPSRLLDLTSNPLVALFFACYKGSNDSNDSVGVVLEAFCSKDEEKISVSSDTVVMLTAMTNTKIKDCEGSFPSSGLAISCVGQPYASSNGKSTIVSRYQGNVCCYSGCITFKKDGKKKRDRRAARLKKKWEIAYVGELSHQCKKEGMNIYWDDVCFQELNQCVLVHPPLNNPRIVRQNGCFIMCGMNPRDIFSPPDSLYLFFNNPKGTKYIYYILPEDKDKILYQLKTLGIDEYFIFPEFDKDIKKVVSERASGTTFKLDANNPMN